MLFYAVGSPYLCVSWWPEESGGGEREPSNEGRKDGMNELGLARDLFLLECVLVCVLAVS